MNEPNFLGPISYYGSQQVEPQFLMAYLYILTSRRELYMVCWKTGKEQRNIYKEGPTRDENKNDKKKGTIHIARS